MVLQYGARIRAPEVMKLIGNVVCLETPFFPKVKQILIHKGIAFLESQTSKTEEF